MTHETRIVAGQGVLVFFEPHFRDAVPLAMETIQRHLADIQIKWVFNMLSLVNITDKEATLFSMDGDMISLPI